MTTVGFIGLGIMGTPMAANLLADGVNVRAFTRTKAKLDAFAASGGVSADSVQDAARGADFVITMLPDSPDVEAVALGESGAIANMDSGAVFIDMSTIREDVARKIAKTAAEHGIEALDAPVSGGEQAAIEGKLSIMVGGSPDAFRRAEPVFGAMGATVVRVGNAGAGQTTKAANQMIVAGNIQMLAEALVFLEAQGVDTDLALQAIGSGLAGSVVLDRKGSSMRERSFQPGFRAELHHKDLAIAQAAAREHGAITPVTSLIAQFMGALVAQGHGTLDHSALLKHVEVLSGRTDAGK